MRLRCASRRFPAHPGARAVSASPPSRTSAGDRMTRTPVLLVALSNVLLLARPSLAAERPAPPRPLPARAAQAAPYATVRVFYATDRSPTGSLDPAERYGPERGLDAVLSVGSCDVSIPVDHREGELEEAGTFTLRFGSNPASDVVVLSARQTNERTFFDEIRDRTAASRAHQALVYVHGYNTSFGDAIRRSAQLAHDVGFDGPVLCYAWPSRGTYLGYAADEDTVEWTVPHLKRVLERVAALSGATSVHVVAHSMGARAVATVV